VRVQVKSEFLLSDRQNLSFSPHFWSASAVLWTACVLGMAISPMNRVDWYTATISDKTVHGFAFAVGTIVWALALRGIRSHSLTPIFIGSLISLGLGGLIEILQKFVPGRSSDSADLLADVIGVVLAAGLLFSILYYKQNKTNN
jgi:VanZ family protein